MYYIVDKLLRNTISVIASGSEAIYKPLRTNRLLRRFTPRNDTFIIVIILAFFPIDAYAYRIGNFELTPRGKLAEKYDDNVTYVKDSKKDDFITILSLGLDAKYERKTSLLNISADTARNSYKDNSDFNNNSSNISLNFMNELSKYDRLSIKEAFSHTYEPRSFEDEFGRTGGRYSSYRNNINLGYSKDITKQLGVSARYSNKIDTYSREDLSDSYFNSIGLETGYALTSRTNFLVSCDYAMRDFNPGENSSTHSLAAGIRQYLTTQLYFDGKIGEDFITSYNEETYTKPSFSASLTNELGQNTSTNLSFLKQYSTNSYTQDLFDYWQVSSAIAKDLTPRLGCSISAFYGRGEYVSTTVTDKLIGSNINFTYTINGHWQTNLSYAFSQTQSTTDSREYSKNVTSIEMIMKF